jgi:glycolate oxidase iron-sulfur subunit
MRLITKLPGTRRVSQARHLQAARELAYQCIRCASCLPACPTYGATLLEHHGPRGRIALVRAVAEQRLAPSEALGPLDACIGCRACEPACPPGVAYGAILEHFRAATEPLRPRSPSARCAWSIALRVVLGTPWGLRVAAIMYAVYRKSGLRKLLHRTRMATWLGPIAELDLALASVREPEARCRVRWRVESAPRRPRVALFRGCVQDIVLSHVTAAAARVLQAAGYDVVLSSRQGCCGALHMHMGYRKDALRMAARNIEAFASEDVEFIVAIAGGCGAALKEYGNWVADRPSTDLVPAAAAFAARVRDFSEVLDARALPHMGPVERTICYQDSCHLRNVQRITDGPRALLQAIPGVRYVELPGADRCCGAGGAYNITQPAMSRYLLDRKMEMVRSTGATVIAVANTPCHIQFLMGVLRRKPGEPEIQVLHLAELLDDAIARRRGEPPSETGSDATAHLTVARQPSPPIHRP